MCYFFQRLCEELEYSDLLDKAADTEDPYQRMVLIAAFSVSPYAATYYRAGQKPFNPLLGETYECIREDKGWKFIAEQVSSRCVYMWVGSGVWIYGGEGDSRG